MRFSRTETLLASAIETRVCPALALDVGGRAGSRWSSAVGRLTFEASSAPCRPDTIFDLASLTKVIATTSIAMRLVADGRLDLDMPVSRVLASWRRPNRRDVRVRQLLDHSSGLPAHDRFWSDGIAGRAAIDARIAALPLAYPTGSRSIYSDVGFIALGFVLETLAGSPLDRQFAAFAAPWSRSLGYRPPTGARARIAPTEVDPWRGRLLVGDVHDENAAQLDGVAAHAGLFGSVEDVAAFARLVLATFHGRTRLGDPDLARRFAARTGVPGSSRALGWDTMRPTSSCGTRLSASAIGHTGFTGTSLWIDWARDLYVVLLSNRVHPTRANDAFVALRPAIHDAVVADLEAAGDLSPASSA
jgi:CubicO group peptidase (beta-lactamase class C family)